MRQPLLAFALGLVVGTVGVSAALYRAGSLGGSAREGDGGVAGRRAPAPMIGAGADEVAELRSTVARLTAENRALAEGLGRARSAAKAAAAGANAVAPDALRAAGDAQASPPPAGAGAPARPVLDAAAVAALVARASELFAAKDGAGLIGLLKEMIAGGETAYPAAMELAAKLFEEGERGGLRVDDRQLRRLFMSDETTPLMRFALVHQEAPALFRRMAVESLAWSGDPELAGFLVQRLPVEKDERVLHNMARMLAGADRPEATAALVDLLRTRTDQPDLRESVLGYLAESASPEVERTVQEMRFSDPDPRLREAAGLFLLAQDPPVAGYLVTETYPDSQAAALGLRKGDILISYNGVEIASPRTLRDETRKVARDQETTVVIWRDGRPVEFTLKGSTIGIDGESVKPRR